MDSNEFINFTSKLKEAENIFLKLSTDEKEKAFKVLLTFKAKCTELCNSQEAAYRVSIPKTPRKRSASKNDSINKSEAFIRKCLDGLITDAVNLIEDKDKVWPSKRLRKRKSSSLQEVNNDEEEAPSPLPWIDPGDDTDDYDFNVLDSMPLSKRKRKQRTPRRTSGTSKNADIKTDKPKKEEPDDMKENDPVILRIAKEAVELANSLNKEERKDFKRSEKLLKIKKKYAKKRGRPVKRILYTCRDCYETFTHSMSHLEHVTSHGHNPCACRNCFKEFITSAELTAHSCRRKQQLICKLCPNNTEKFISNKLLNNHLKNVHGIFPMSRNYPCKFCGKPFTTKLWLHHHYKQHADGKEVCLRCGEFSDNAETLQEHMKTHEKECHFKCVKCDAGFYHARQYDQHILAHLQRECALCDEKFKSRSQLSQHCLSTHELGIDEILKQKYTCDECTKSFERPSALIVHQRLHTGERPVECKPCHQFFRTNKALAKHKQTYSHSIKAGEKAKERKFLCSECGKAYFRKHALQRHMRYHTGEKPHTCQHCGYQCREANNLKRHLSLHFEAERNFVCELCGSAFHAKKTLEMHHAYKHSDVRQFACSLCSLTFKAKNALKRHYKVHSTEKEHKCWCGTAFKRMYNLRRHLKAVHGADTILPPVRRVQPLDQPTKAPVSKTDLQNPKVMAEKKEKVAKPRRKPYQTMPSQLVITMDSYQNATPAAIAEEISEGLKYVPSMLMNVEHQQTVHSQAEHCYSMNQSPSTPVTSPHRQPIMRQQPTPHSQQPEPSQIIQTDDGQHRMRYNTNPEGQVYTNVMERPAPLPHNVMDRTAQLPHNIDPNDPFMQHMNTSLGNPSFIPQAVAYSTIMREYGSQFPFLPDGTNYHNYVNVNKAV